MGEMQHFWNLDFILSLAFSCSSSIIISKSLGKSSFGIVKHLIEVVFPVIQYFSPGYFDLPEESHIKGL